MNSIELANAVATLLSRKDMTRAELARRCIAAEHTLSEERAARINLEHEVITLRGAQAPMLGRTALMAIARRLSQQDRDASYRVGLNCVERFNKDTRTWNPVEL